MSDNNSDFQIGQTIFILSNKSQTVLPGIIQEEINHRSLNGNSVSYKILIGPPNSPKAKIIDLTRVDGEVYGSLEDIREVLINRLTNFVEELCEQTRQRIQDWYGTIPNTQQSGFVGNPGDKIDPALLMNEVNSNPAPQYVQIQGNQAVPVNLQSPQGNVADVKRQIRQSVEERE